MIVQEAIEHLQKHYESNDHIAMHVWCIDDVFDTATEEKIRLSSSEAEEIIDDIHHHIDSEYGVTWVTLQCYIQDFDRDRKGSK